MNQSLEPSANEVKQYQEELAVAAQEDAGCIRRIQGLEEMRDGAELGAQMICQRGVELGRQFQGKVGQLGSQLELAQERLSELESDREYAQTVAMKLQSDGLEEKPVE